MRSRTVNRGLFVLALATASISLVGCGVQPVPTPSPTASSPSPTPSPTADPLAGMTLQERVGQLFMVGTPADTVGSDAMSAVVDRHVGSIFLSGRSDAGTDATAGIVAQFTGAASEPLFVATDQEGGQVQVLSGPGFSEMPSALDQGGMAPGDLQASAATWGAELKSAGVNLNLAPVADVVTGPDSTNQPIASYDREFGYDAATVQSHAQAFVDGMHAAGVTSTVKHFPGLGYVGGNTDDTAGVTDTVVSPTNVQVFGPLIDGGAPVVMVSSAIYSLIDPSAPACFSPAVVTKLLRGTLGFDGLVLTDDLSGATQVQAWSPADRAILSIEAGADIVLVTRIPTVAPEMIDAVVAKAQDDPAFAALVDAAARRVVEQKTTLGL